MRKKTDKLYFDWLCEKINCDSRPVASYEKILDHLHAIDYIWSIPMDENREFDGLALRYEFASHLGINQDIIFDNDKKCSVLEMMVALCIRASLDYVGTVDYWFWTMMRNLKLDNMTDDFFDMEVASGIISAMLYREYDKDGNGALFYIKNCQTNMRSLEIWSQMLWYMDEHSEDYELQSN